MIVANQTQKNTQPRHAMGSPHPQPERFARNQYLVEGSVTSEV
jgi:hypothetical protein